ncbi:MAG TPA: hypothetical protein VIH42_04245 [Thermoguttaceae bacterium]
MKSYLLTVAAILGLTCILHDTARAEIDYGNLSWSVQYMIDQSQTVLGVNQFDTPRNNRGLALSPDNQYLYAGYNNTDSGYCVRKIDLSQPDYTDATLVNLVGVSRGKAIGVDDVGRVYLGDSTAIKIYDANLSSLQYTLSITGGALEGIDLVRDGGQLVLYNSDRNSGNLSKWLLTESGGSITGAALDTSFGSSGAVSLAGNIRGVEVDPTGRIWVAGRGTNSVYVVAGDGSSYSTISGVNTPLDIGFDGNTALVTTEYNLNIKRYSISDLSSAGSDLVPPLSALELTATPLTGGPGAIDYIAVAPGLGFYLSGDGINTAGEKSTYGRIDGESGWSGGKFYTDLTHDDNDAILFVTPEPCILILFATGVTILLMARVMRRRVAG